MTTWKISEEYRLIIVKRLMKIVADPTTEDHNAINAAKVLQSLENDNEALQSIRIDDDVPEYASILGIESGVSSNG